MISNSALGSFSILRWLVRIEEAFGALLLGAIVVLVALQILGRYVIDAPLVWTDEVARLALVWMTFVGAAFVMARGEHINIELFDERLHPKVRVALEVFATLVVAAVCIGFVPGAAQVASDTAGVRSPALGFSRGLIYAAAVTGFTLIAVHALLKVLILLRGGASTLAPGPQVQDDAV